MHNRNRLKDIENTLVVTRGRGQRRGEDYEYGIKRYKLICIKQIRNKDIYSTAQRIIPLSCSNFQWSICMCVC